MRKEKETFASLGGNMPTVTLEFCGDKKPLVFTEPEGKVRVLLMPINK